ncbi:MAG TPA: protein kinase [Pyrinomonadaceae bacterium]|jgi:serine/threonine-protein kinase|nr:protein kinase [Pyrinomonadaceae bacterium]
MSSCPHCGAEVTPADRFCGDCGSPLANGAGEQSASWGGDADAPELLESSTPEPATFDATPAASPDPPAAASAMPAASTSAESAPLESGSEVSSGASGVASAAGDGAGAAVARAASPSAALAAAAPPAGDDADAAAHSGGDEGVGGGDGGVAPSESRAGTTGEVNSPAPAARRDTDGDRMGTSGVKVSAGATSRGDSTGGRRSTAKPLDPATLLYSRYEIVRRIGGGGMGAVYLAKDRNLGDQPRAVKEMIQSNIDESQHEKAINDFRRESMLLSSLEHQSIPTIYDYFYDDGAGRFYLVMKYISGGDFLARLRNAPGGRLDEKTVTDWGCQVADVLHYLHRQNPPIIYRDLKPANLMIDGNSGRVMLIDFGIARWVQKEEKGVTAVGTMGYAPPELFSGKVEPRSDIYSLGATMFHLLTGSDPQDNPLLIFDFNKNPRPRQITPSLSNEMEAILMRAVEYKPENRFRSAAELRDTLSDHLEKLRAGQVTYGMAQANVSANLKTMQVEMVYCGFCGGRIAGEDVYCAHCGQRQPMAVASAALRQARATAKLVVTGTTELDSSFMLQKESSLVGRSDPHSNIFPEVDLSRFDPQTKISRRHARIFRKGDTYLVEDLGSVNGTVINDTLRLAPHQPRALESGDKLRVGETTLHFLIG